eukprot:jgi/Psemu1/95/gm1.95_g
MNSTGKKKAAKKRKKCGVDGSNARSQEVMGRRQRGSVVGFGNNTKMMKLPSVEVVVVCQNDGGGEWEASSLLVKTMAQESLFTSDVKVMTTMCIGHHDRWESDNSGQGCDETTSRFEQQRWRY